MGHTTDTLWANNINILQLATTDWKHMHKTPLYILNIISNGMLECLMMMSNVALRSGRTHFHLTRVSFLLWNETPGAFHRWGCPFNLSNGRNSFILSFSMAGWGSAHPIHCVTVQNRVRKFTKKTYHNVIMQRSHFFRHFVFHFWKTHIYNPLVRQPQNSFYRTRLTATFYDSHGFVATIIRIGEYRLLAFGAWAWSEDTIGEVRDIEKGCHCWAWHSTPFHYKDFFQL